MTILCLATCTEQASVALMRDGTLLGASIFPARTTLVSRLLLRVEWVLSECGLGKGDIGAIAVAVGPGKFTGVRIGVTVAKVLAATLKVPVVGISALEALAGSCSSGSAATVVPVINARRGQVYCAAFSVERDVRRRLKEDQALSAAPLVEFLAELPGPVIVAGALDGLPEALQTALFWAAVTVDEPLRASALAGLAAERLARGEADDPLTLEPLYLRPPAD